MRVVTHLRAFYDYVPCPPDVKVTDADVAAGRAKRKSPTDPWLIRVKKTTETHNLTAIPEIEIIKHMIGMAMPSQGKQKLSRKAAVADYLSKHNARAVHFDNADIKSIEVHDDEWGPGGVPAGVVPVVDVDGKVTGHMTAEEMVRSAAAQYTAVTHPSTGAPLLTPSDVDALVALHREPHTSAELADHLHERFGVPKPKGA